MYVICPNNGWIDLIAKAQHPRHVAFPTWQAGQCSLRKHSGSLVTPACSQGEPVIYDESENENENEEL
jgi:hypothetical protein